MRADRKIDGPDDNKTILRYRTISEFATALKASIADKMHDRLQSVCGTERFTGTESAPAYIRMLDEGWRTGVDAVEGLEGLSTDMADKIGFVRSVGGAFPIVPAFLAGAPDAMLMPVVQPAESVRGLTLVIDGCFVAGVEARDILDYAHSVMRLIAWLQAEQIDTSIYIVAAARQDTHRMLYVTSVREAGDIMQPERIAALVHPSFFRRAVFAMWEREYYDHGSPLGRAYPGSNACKHNYSYPSESTAEELRQALPDTYSIIKLPHVGKGDPMRAVQESETFKLRQEK